MDEKGLIERIIDEVSSLNYSFAVDAHCHIESDVFTDNERREIIKRAISKRIIMFSTPLTANERKRALELYREYTPWIELVVGSHPLYNEDVEKVIEWIESHSRVIKGIGEVGLDFAPPNNTPEVMKAQIEKFNRFIDLAIELDKPLVIHSRSAGRQAIDILIKRGAEKVLLHAFSGKAKYALRGAEAGYFFSIPPSVAFSPQKKKLVKALPIDNIMLETDAPVFSPIRGKNSEPIFVLFSAAMIAMIKDMEIKDVIEITTKNAVKLFKISSPLSTPL